MDVDSVASDVVELIGLLIDRIASQLALVDCTVIVLVMMLLVVNINSCDQHKLPVITIITQRIHSVHMMTLMHGVLACVYKF